MTDAPTKEKEMATDEQERADNRLANYLSSASCACGGTHGDHNPVCAVQGMDAIWDAAGKAAQDISLLRWLMKDGDRCAGVVADAYANWDTDVPWEQALRVEIEFRFKCDGRGNQ